MQIRCALVGMPGAGKSTVGQRLADRVGVPFIDLDQWLEQAIGSSIRSYFEAQGEERFRDLESQGLAEVARQPGGLVLATGGGAVLRAPNRAVLRQFGHVLYLWAMPEDLYQRVKHDQTRPLLQTDDPLRRLRQLYAERDPLYRATARCVIQTGQAAVGTLVDCIMRQLELAPPPP
ncbi:shikimate kinase [Verminephrobacter eiseniae]|uniref:Shikimate kinase n=1 Tax=Verminephrobacter eiseniae (strain EF01-2) TaxID=391735 RepID=A1WDU9_VEREI|nr:shikimate kinase [Verminephrobacter eiseniae]ABM55806.1 shikimate kinase [Verminephrobacter eiseniae EF01-2]MCW5286186.1 shikimate kinase [Verminephrobacter eiseniae]MCW5304485.1 shikimate kinase [Verminephrobacter eiseniae]MCW8182000.1 shikimate kinase [Verminephrobacter eiseniae]MCW8192570.1 shikimate kinase [Verminephrobacter eiseniae]